METMRKRVAWLSVILLVGCIALLPKYSQGQAVLGNKGVYNSAGNVAPSTVWIDASAFWTTTMGNPPDICWIISNDIMTSSYGTSGNYPNGAVIDSRGLYNSNNGGAITCTGTPFANFTTKSPPPTTILLPATTIPIPTTWVLPNNVKIVGEEQNTIITPKNPSGGSFSGNDAIDMGSSTLCSAPCSGIAIEHLSIDLSLLNNINGIVNNNAEFSSYVNDVSLHLVGCAGLIVGAPSSGPYTNISLSAVSAGTCPNTSGAGSNVQYPLCVDLEAPTRGVHGATCTGKAALTGHPAAIYVNASNNTVEDVHVETFWDGVQIGDTTSNTGVGNVVVSNITGGNNGNGAMKNIVHICGAYPVTGGGCLSYGTVTDTAVLQSTYGPVVSGITSVQDDVTGTSVPATGSAPPSSLTGMYVLGEAIAGGYSRFSTSPTATSTSSGNPTTAPTWAVGSHSGITGETCTTPGAVYSNTGGGSRTSVFVCTSSKQWEPIV